MKSINLKREPITNNVPVQLDKSAPPRITFTWEYITPDKAEAYLAKNFDRNRSPKKNLLKRLTTALKEGWFYPTHQGIAISPEDELIDGQNRLTAIRDSGVASWLVIARGVHVAHIEAIDRGAMRSDSDNITMITGEKVTIGMVATGKDMYCGLNRSSRISDHPLREFISTHQQALDFACHTQGGKKGLVAPLRAIVAKAWYYVDEGMLTEFMTVIATGVTSNQAQASLIRLRDYVRDPRNVGNRDMKNQVMRRTIYALQNFLAGKEFNRLLEWPGDDPWPLDDDESAKETEE